MTWDDVHDARRVFRCLLDAIGHPGTPVPFPKVGIPPVAAVLLSLVDDSTTLCLPEGEAAEAFRAHGTAHYVPPAEARFVVTDSPAEVIPQLATGAPEHPEHGATVIVTTATPTEVTLRGPGVDGELLTALPLSPAALDARDRACATPPFGVDLFVIAGGTVVALPRSTEVVR